MNDHPPENTYDVAGSRADEPPKPRAKGVYIGAPSCFALELACKQVHDAFAKDCEFGEIYLVGSALQRADWRDVDLRFMMDDEAFKALFPRALLVNACWEFDPRWLLMTVTISEWMKKSTALPIDFQFQPMTFANERHKGPRSAIGLGYVTRQEYEKQ